MPSSSSEDRAAGRLASRATDIVAAIGLIRRFTQGMDLQSFASDDKTRAAVERELEIISEACTKIRNDEIALNMPPKRTLESRFPAVPWAHVRGIGNRLRHEYERIDVAVIWKTVAESTDLEDLARALRAAFPATLE